MSHFTVMVIGDDFEGQLAPFHEFECTGINDQYVQDEDITEEIQSAIDEGDSIEDALDYHGLAEKIVDDESKVDKVGDDCEHKFGYAIVKDGKLIKAVNRTNPNRKWDWYQVGGRWSGFLTLKPEFVGQGQNGDRSWTNRDEAISPTKCDSALKSQIDFEGMRKEDGDAAAKRWDEAHAAIAGRTWKTWEQIGEEITEAPEGQNLWDVRRKAYHSQEGLTALRAVFDNPFANLDEYLVSREEYIQQYRDGAISTYALLKDGVWYEKGEMGWWGMSNDKMSQGEWNAQVAKLLDELPDDTRITIVDCHI